MCLPHRSEVESLGMVYLISEWILDRYICLSGFIFAMFIWLIAHPHSDRHWPGRDCFFYDDCIREFSAKQIT